MSNQEFKPVTVFCEGNIGCGKSTFLDYLKSQKQDVQVFPENISLWRNFNGLNLLVSEIIDFFNNDFYIFSAFIHSFYFFDYISEIILRQYVNLGFTISNIRQSRYVVYA